MQRRPTTLRRCEPGFPGAERAQVPALVLLLLLLAGHAGCADNPAAQPADAALIDANAADGAGVADGADTDADVLTTASDGAVAGWPAAGCGKLVGQTICPVALMGYGHPTGQGGAHPDFALELSLHTLIRSAPTAHVLVLLGGAWCPSCKISTTMAINKGGEVASHVTFINVLIEGDTPKLPARKSHIDDWIKKLNVPFAIVADAYDTPLVARKVLGLRESAMLVDRATGEVLARAETLAKLWPKLAGFAAAGG